MKIEIDQSGKIENTSKPTVIGFSNKNNKTIIIFATEKQRLQRYFRKVGKPNLFVYQTFSILIYLLLRNQKQIEQIVIDKEYVGQEPLIKSYLLTLLRKNGRHFDKRRISFRQVGKKSAVHRLALAAYKKKKADKKIFAKDLLKHFFK
jgi:hypothetical protein